MSEKALAPSVTHRDPKGRKFMDIVAAAYDKAQLSKEEAQRVNDTPGLADLVGEFIAGNRGGKQFVPPKGGRVHILWVPVRPDREWEEAVNAGGPDTPQGDNVRKVGDQYPPKSGAAKEVELILLNFGPNGGTWDQAIAWAKQYSLERSNPRHVFAIGEHKPKLNRKLGLGYMYVVATEERAFEGYRLACGVWWRGSERGCGLDWVGSGGLSIGWFAFFRE